MKITDLAQVFHRDPEIMGGTPVFTGTRVPVQNLVDYLEGGESIDNFLEGFPTVKRQQVIGFIEAEKEKLLVSGLHECSPGRVSGLAPGTRSAPSQGQNRPGYGLGGNQERRTTGAGSKP